MDHNGDEWQQGKGRYQAFLLRCWQECELRNGEESARSFVWRFTLVQPNDRSQPECFASLEDLTIYLRGRLDQVARDGANSSDDSLNRPLGKKP